MLSRPLRRYRAVLAYDGTNYAGFQRQAGNQPTIQGEVERALQTLTNQTALVIGSGRTDSGVHASGQVISFDISWKHGVEALQRALNATLPNDIAVWQLDEAPEGFHPRFDARSRVYVYRIYNHPVRSPLHGRYHWHVPQPLDITAMNSAAMQLVGTHDFATFGTPPQGKNTVRHLWRSQWTREGAVLTYTIEGNAFLYRMVRSIVGSLKLVGEAAWSVETFIAAFHARQRERCGTVAPPHGLCLIAVNYESKLADKVDTTAF